MEMKPLFKRGRRSRYLASGAIGLREFGVWWTMINRCENPKVKCFKNYGGRGIKVCHEWHLFENFLLDMGPRPAGTRIERIDNNGDYCASNCRWATPREQGSNRRGNVRLTLNGRTQILSQWARELGMMRETLRERIKLGWSEEKALTAPLRITSRHRRPL